MRGLLDSISNTKEDPEIHLDSARVSWTLASGHYSMHKCLAVEEEVSRSRNMNLFVVKAPRHDS